MLKIINAGNNPWFISTNVPTEIQTDRIPVPGRSEQLEVGETLVLRTGAELEVSLTRDTLVIKHV